MKTAERAQIELNDSAAAAGLAIAAGVPPEGRSRCARLVRATEAVLALPTAPLPGLKEEVAAGVPDLHRAGLSCLAGDGEAARADLDAAEAARTGSEERIDKLLFGTSADR
jgi:hypothetical protein